MRNLKGIRLHARQRAVERYGVSISDAKRRKIINLIHAGKTGRFVKRRSVRVSEWEIPLDGETFRVLYDKRRKEIVTFLPPRNKSATKSSI